MLNFDKFLIEASTAQSEEKLTHLEHAEDHPVNAGAAGFAHAKKTLNAVHSALIGNKSEASITTKYDGSPSIVFGRHPENGKFFVASKSAFNKTPKINYTEDDIDKNHGHAPGLAAKLKIALKHLPKVTPKEGIYQGDIMHSGVQSKANPGGDVQMFAGKANFKPNTITYSTKGNEGEAVSKSKIGVAIHTAYHGSTFDNMKAKYNAGSAGFHTHPDVHLLDVSHPVEKSKYSEAQQDAFKKHMAQAEESHKQLKSGSGYDALQGHTDHIKTYINRTVRESTSPSTEGYRTHLAELHQKAADKVKTASAKAAKTAVGAELVGHTKKHQEHFDNLWKMHHHLQSAKNELVHALSTHTRYTHTIGGARVKPEGFVATINNRPTKLVDREEFSKANFEQNRG